MARFPALSRTIPVPAPSPPESRLASALVASSANSSSPGMVPEKPNRGPVLPSCHLSHCYAVLPSHRLAVTPYLQSRPQYHSLCLLAPPWRSEPRLPVTEIILLRLAAKLDYSIYEGAMSIYPLSLWRLDIDGEAGERVW